MQDNVKSLVDTRLRRVRAVVDVAREFEHDDGYRGEEGCLEIDSEKKKSIKNERKRKKICTHNYNDGRKIFNYRLQFLTCAIRDTTRTI